MKHPAVLVFGGRAQPPAQPRAAPFVHHRPMALLHDGFTTQRGRDNASLQRFAWLFAEGRSIFMRKTGARERVPIAIGAPVVVGKKRRHRVELSDTLIIDARRHGEHVAFNCFHSAEQSVRWRAFSVADRDRRIIDLVDGKPQPTSFGVTLNELANVTVEQGAQLDAAIARAAVDALVQALLKSQTTSITQVTLTWDGDTHVEGAYVVSRALFDNKDLDIGLHDIAARKVVSVFRKLCRNADERITSRDVDAVIDTPPAPREDVARFLRALFADAWAVEAALREEVGVLDVESLP